MRILSTLIPLAAASLIASCGGGIGPETWEGGAPQIASASALPSATSCGYDHIYVTVERLKVFKTGAAPEEITLPSPRRLDLVGLESGVLQALGLEPLRGGHFTEVRLLLAPNTGTASGVIANAVQEAGKTLVPLNTPSARQSGIKLQSNLDLARGQLGDLFIDAGVCQPVMNLGKEAGYVLRPVLSVEPRIIVASPQGEFRVNTTTAGDQNWPVVTSLRSGGYVVAWTDTSGVFMQRFDAAGQAIGGEVKIDIGTQVNPQEPAVAGLANGGYVVAWKSFRPESPLHGSSVYAQAYGADGSTVGAQALVSVGGAATDEYQQSIIPLGQSGYLVTWTAYYGLASVFPSVYGQRFDAGGVKVGTPAQLVAPALGAWVVAAASLTDGGYVIAWIDGGGGVHTQSFGPSGDARSVPKFVGSSAASTVVSDGVAVMGVAGGGYVVAWVAQHSGTGWDIFAQQFDAAGAPESDIVAVNSVTALDQFQPRVASSRGGGYAVVWISRDASGWGIYMQRFDAQSGRLGGNTLVNTTTESNQVQPDIAGLLDDGYLVTWMSYGQPGAVGSDIYAQRYAYDGSAL